MVGSVAGGRHGARAVAENLIYNLEAETGPGVTFWNLRACPQWNTSSNEAASPHLSPDSSSEGLGIQRHELMGGIPIQTPRLPRPGGLCV